LILQIGVNRRCRDYIHYATAPPGFEKPGQDQPSLPRLGKRSTAFILTATIKAISPHRLNIRLNIRFSLPTRACSHSLRA
jgi:hypothetical protein